MKAIISMTTKPYAQEIRIDDASAYVTIVQDGDTVCVSEGQFPAFLPALLAAAKAKGWPEERAAKAAKEGGR